MMCCVGCTSCKWRYGVIFFFPFLSRAKREKGREKNIYTISNRADALFYIMPSLRDLPTKYLTLRDLLTKSKPVLSILLNLIY